MSPLARRDRNFGWRLLEFRVRAPTGSVAFSPMSLSGWWHPWLGFLADRGRIGKAGESVVVTMYLEKARCLLGTEMLAIWCKLRVTRVRVMFVGIKRLMLKFGRCRSASRLPQCITLDSLTSTANKRTLTLGLSLTSSLLIRLYVMLYLSHAQLVRI